MDPDNVGSSIRYRTTVFRGNSNRLCAEAEVMLTDCDRGIRWCAYGGDLLQLTARIDNAIDVLVEARDAIGAIASVYVKRNKKRSRK